jgi:ATP-dependent Lhr-like helicase
MEKKKMSKSLDGKVENFIKNDLRWLSFTEVQKKAIPKILDGNNVLIESGTASGKTEAAMIPILDLMLKDKAPGIRCIYFAPLKALINDITNRLMDIFKPFGFDVARWHGEVSLTDKKHAISKASVLVTTPESMEGMLTSKNVSDETFKNLRFVVADEVHNFAASPRGSQMVCLFERLQLYTEYKIQRIAMSATVGSIQGILDWFVGGSELPSVIVSNSRQRTRSIHVVHEDEIDITKLVMHLQKKGNRKIIIFTDSRKNVEKYSRILNRNGVHALTHHSSVSKELREHVESRFKAKRKTMVIIATSTLEMGIDIGDIDLVLFLDVPYTNASFVQKIGRAGRKSSHTKAWVIARDYNSQMRLLGVSQMLEDGIVEGIFPLDYYPQLLAHQLISFSYERGKLKKEELAQLLKARPFKRIGKEDFKAVTDYLIKNDFLYRNPGGELLPGDKTNEVIEIGAKKMGFVVLFPGSIEYQVVHRGTEIGTLQPIFVQVLKQERESKGEAIFNLANHGWKVSRIDDSKMKVIVEEAHSTRVPDWMSLGARIEYDFAQAIRKAIISRKIPETVICSRSLKEQLQHIIDQESETISKKPVRCCEYDPETKGITLYTYFGDLGNLFATILLNIQGVKSVKRDWRMLFIRGKKEPEYYLELLKELASKSREELSHLITMYILDNPKTMKYLYNQLGDSLKDYADEHVIAKSQAEFIIDERVCQNIVES